MSLKYEKETMMSGPRALRHPKLSVGTIPLAPLRDSSGVTPQAAAAGLGGSFIVDALGHILAFDRAMEKLTGWRAFEVVGQHKDLGVYDRPDETGQRRFEARPLFDGTLPRVGRSTTTRMLLHRKDGAQLEADVIITPLGGQGVRFSVEIKHVVARIGAPISAETQEKRDALTRLPNAEAFREQLRETFSAVKRVGHTMAVLFVNIDHLASLEERYGNDQAGDVLQRLAGILRASLRSTDYVARVNQDHFGILLTGTGRGDARAVGGRIRQTIEKFAFSRPGGSGEMRVTVSIGVACFPADGETPSELMRRAQEALAEAHRLGRNRVWCYVRRPRVPLEVPVYFDGPSGHLIGTSRDLSNSGLFIETRDMLPLGMRLGLSFRLPESTEPMRLIGSVARQVPAPQGASDSPPGLGVEFERFNPEDRRRIEAYIHKTRLTGT